MDISKKTVNETAAMHVNGPDGQPLYDDGKPVQIIFYGPGSKVFGQVEARQTNRILKRRDDNDGKVTASTYEQRIAETAEDLADVTSAFENMSYGDKQGREMFHAAYSDPGLGYIVKQANKFLADWGKFTQGSQPS